MRARVQYAEYLAEVRKQVCSHCPERSPDRPPFAPLCRGCGVELQLPQLVESICAAGEDLAEFGPPPDSALVCAQCVCRESLRCPCPAGLLRERLVRAVKTVNERREQGRLLQGRLACQARREGSPVAALVRAYEAATGTCVCCD